MPDLTPLEVAETLELHAPWVGGTYRDAMLKAAADERQIAAGELRPVIHAYWKGQSSNVGYRCVVHFACSNCGYEIADDETVNKLCPSCGALMDGKDDSHAN